jgi:hypothetical protein
MIRSTFFVGGLLLSLLASCGPKGGTDVGNGATVSVNLRGYERKAMTISSGVKLSSGVEIDEVWIAVRDFKLRDGNCNGREAVEPLDFVGPVVAEIVDVGVVGPAPEFGVATGEYCRLRVRLHPLEAAELPEGAPAALAGNAVLVSGRRADGVPFTIATQKKFDFRLDATGSSFSVEGDEPFIIGFELATIIAAMELDTYDDAYIVIDDESDPQGVQRFNRALRQSAQLFRDDDDDGALSPSESAPGRAVAADLGN